MGFGRLRTALYLLFRQPHKARRLLALSRAPIVIGGSNRSGTSLLLSVLSCHPDVIAVRGETHGLCQRLKLNPTRLNPPVRMWRVYQRLAQFPIPPHARRWCEKTPRNVRNYAEIIDYFGPDVRIINIVRDGRDVTTSFHRDDTDTPMMDHDKWAEYVNLGRSMEDHPQVLTIRYEDLVLDLVNTAKRICEHTGLAYTDAFERYPDSAGLKEHRGGWVGKARPVSPESIGRWRDPQFSDRIRTFHNDPLCMELLEHYGYERDV